MLTSMHMHICARLCARVQACVYMHAHEFVTCMNTGMNGRTQCRISMHY